MSKQERGSTTQSRTERIRYATRTFNLIDGEERNREDRIFARLLGDETGKLLSVFSRDTSLNRAKSMFDDSLSRLGRARDTSKKQSDGDATLAEHDAVKIHEAGASIIVREKLRSLRRLVGQRQIPLDRFIEVHEFRATGPVDIQVGGVSIQNIHDQGKRNPIQVGAQLRFFMEMRSLVQGYLPRNFHTDNNSELGQTYPNMQLQNLQRALHISTAMLNYAYNTDLPEYKAAAADFKPESPAAKRLIDKTREFHTRLKRVLVTPDDPEFGETKAVVEEYLGAPPEIVAELVNSISFYQRESVQNLYRTFLQLRGHDQHGAFYGRLTDLLFDYTESVPDSAEFYTRNSLGEIYTPPAEFPEEQRPKPTDLREAIAALIPNKPRDVNRFSITEGLDSINWFGLITPQSVTIELNHTKPMDFLVTFSYKNNAEETTTVSFEVDAKKGRLFWNFLEDPQSPDMRDFTDASLLAAAQLLQNTAVQLAEKKAEVQSAKRRIQPAQTQSRTQALVIQPEAVRSSPAFRKDKIRKAVPFAIIESEENRVRQTILMPEDETMARIFAKVDRADQFRVARAIDTFNISRGRLKALKTRHDGVRLFSLRVGNMRVLLTEAENQGGLPDYAIEDIDYRQNVYKNLK